jgi:hypothetical protein
MLRCPVPLKATLRSQTRWLDEHTTGIQPDHGSIASNLHVEEIQYMKLQPTLESFDAIAVPYQEHNHQHISKLAACLYRITHPKDVNACGIQ